MVSSVKALETIIKDGWFVSQIYAIWIPMPEVTVTLLSNDGGEIIIKGTRDLYSCAMAEAGK